MLFNSYEFLLAFLPVTFVGFFLIGRLSAPLAALWMAGASIAFYGYWSPRLVVLLLGSVAFNYGCGYAIGHIASMRQRRYLLVFSISADLLVLGAFKYTNFFLQSLDFALGLQYPLLDIVLPLGISFFTFTQIAYLVDVYRRLAREYNPIHYLLFVTYFPHLISGPILHHQQMMPQFEDPRTYRPDFDKISAGVLLFTLGLAKKVLVADRFAPLVTPVFDGIAAHGIAPGVGAAWTAALAYTLQLYFDFSGYCDMAMGLSLLFGVHLPVNFNSPYKAASIIDFWRRWHITLSHFLRDYLYIPLGGNRKGTFPRYANLMITMLLGGLWHGASWTFVAWGGLHGLYLLVNHGWRRWRRPTAAPGPRYQRVASACLVFLAVVIAWVFFRSATFKIATLILLSMSGFGPPGGPHQSVVPVLFGLVIVFLAPNSLEISERLHRLIATPNSSSRSQIAKPLLVGIVVAMLLFASVTQFIHVSPFLYYQF